MKTKHLKRFFLSIAITAFVAILAGNALAANQNLSRDGDSTTYAPQATSNDFIVAAPYWQVDSGSYTFMAVSHSSLSGMASEIGLIINAIDSTGAAYDTAETFTVSAGTTTRVFIVPTNHATVNSTNITTAKFLAGTSDFTYGHVRINPKASAPQLIFGAQGCGGIRSSVAGGECSQITGRGFRDITMLTYWGSVIIEANTTGFAMEFVGDMNDSHNPSLNGAVGYMTSGPNLQ
ncbi:MAG TPA: hypothetical protein EYN35_02150 [Methylococcales bacterium]|nr:hypothetical protein [Methylococcales bacterium]